MTFTTVIGTHHQCSMMVILSQVWHVLLTKDFCTSMFTM